MFDSQDWQNALLGRITATEFWHAIGPRLGLDSHKKIEDFRRRYDADASINRGVRDIIRNLRGRYKLSVLSNSPPGLGQWLFNWGVLDLFDVIFCSGDERLKKPDPGAYKTVLKRLEVLPHEAIFIDDTSGHVVAAQRLGIQSIIFTTADQLTRELKALLPVENNLYPE